MRLPRRHAIVTLSLACLTAWSLRAQVLRDVGPACFPAHDATGVSPDTPLALTFDELPVVGTSGGIRVYDAGAGTLVDRLDLSIRAGPTQPPPATATSNAGPLAVYQRTVIGGFTEGFHFYPILVRERTATITLHHGVLKYGRRYYVEIDPDVIKASGFAGFSGSRAWTFQTRAAPPAANATRIVVAADGSADFTTVQGAVDFVPDTPASRVTIFIRRGRYEEIVYFRNKKNLTFLGEDRDAVVIGYANNEIFNGPPPGVRTNERPGTFPYRRAAFMADGSTGIHLVNLTLRNFTPFGGSQAEALLLMGGRNIVSHVNAYSHQDTVQFNDPVYIADSLIEGDTDFLWGRGPAFFERTTVRELSNSPFMWVRSTSASHGFVFVDCRFETPGSTEAGPVLARNTAAYPDSEIVLIDSAIGRIHPEAWQLPDDPGRVRYWESGSISLDTGRPADVSARHRASRQLDRTRDAEIIAQYRDPAFVLGGWTPEMAPIVLSAPDHHTAVSSGTTISLAVTVAAIPQPTYQWLRGTTVIADDGRVTGARTRALSITRAVRGDAGQYSVTVSNRAGQAVSSAVQVRVR
jgi:pectinesterase